TAIALKAGTIVGFVLKFLPVTMSGLAITILLGRFWKRATWQGALAALVTTPVVSLSNTFLLPSTSAWNNAVIPTVAGILAHVVISAITPPSRHTFAEIATAMTHEREAIEGKSLVEIPVPSNLSSTKANSL
ncbi:MAG: sodium:proline symporter, partial [Pedosphaera sp.]|nr:sodium:proline symporter [Pedosphaera sp.]